MPFFDEEYVSDILGKTPEQIKAERKRTISKIPDCTASAEEMTEYIQTQKPDYYFQKPSWSEMRARRALMKSARNALLDSVEEMVTDPCSLAGKKLYNSDREAGFNLGLYVQKYMPEEKAELLDLAEKGSAAENYSQRREGLYKRVFLHLADNIGEYREQIAAMDDKTLIKEWKNIAPILKLSDFENSVRAYGIFGKDEEQALCDKLGPILNLNGTTITKLRAIANPAYPVADPEQLLKMSKPQLVDLDTQLDNTFYRFRHMANNGEANAWSIFGSLVFSVGNKISAMTHKVSDLMDAKNERGTAMMARDLDGNSLDGDCATKEIIANGRPVYMLLNTAPDSLPVMVFMKDGEYVFGDDARKAFFETSMPEEPTPPDESRKPTGLWDKICKAFGWESLRSSAARKYDADVEKYAVDHRYYEAKLADYEKTEELRKTFEKPVSEEKLKEVRDQMFMAKYGKDAATVSEEMRARREAELQEQAQKEAKAKVEAEITAQKNAKNRELVKKMDDAGLTEKQKAVIDKIFVDSNWKLNSARRSSYEKDQHPKERCIATGLVCRKFEGVILKGLDAMAQGKPTSKEFDTILEATAKKTTASMSQMISELSKDERVLRAASEMEKAEIDLLCPPKANEESEKQFAMLKEKYGLSLPIEEAPKTKETTLQNGTDARAELDARAAEDMTKQLSEIAKANGYPPEQIPEIVAQAQEQANKMHTEGVEVTNNVDFQAPTEENTTDMQMNALS